MIGHILELVIKLNKILQIWCLWHKLCIEELKPTEIRLQVVHGLKF